MKTLHDKEIFPFSVPIPLSISISIPYIHDRRASPVPHWFVETYVLDYKLVLKQAVIIPPARDTAENANTIYPLQICFVNVVGCG
jgi:hypothetical protein